MNALLLISLCFAQVNQAPKPPQAPSLEDRVTALEAEVAKLKATKAVTQPQIAAVAEIKWVKGNVPGFVGEHMVPEGSPFAVNNSNNRTFTYSGPFMTRSVCFGPNCPK